MKKEEVAILIVFSAFVLSVILSFIFFAARTCNDGTPYNQCSDIVPYFCSGGKLIERPSSCGCPNGMDFDGEKCTSLLKQDPKNITLSYVLRGRKSNIDFVVYKALADNLSAIPRYISSGKNLTALDFKLKMINQEEQKAFLLPLVMEIEKITRNKADQARIAISLVQNIPFGNSSKTIHYGSISLEYQRYPYEVLYDGEGICSEKSDLLIFLLRELGYGTASFYYAVENHEAVGIKCPGARANAGEFCFIETTGPSIITDDKIDYTGMANKLISSPKVTNISDGMSLSNNLYEYEDARILIEIRDSMRKYGRINPIQYLQFKNLKRKYGLPNLSE